MPDGLRGQVGLNARPDYSKLFVRLYVLALVIASALGAVLIGGGEDRFSSPSFTTPRALFGWVAIDAHIIWGCLFVAYGLALIGALGRVVAVHVLRAGIVVYFFLACSFFGSVTVDTRASITGVVVYGGLAVMHLFLSDHLAHRGWERC